jgi:type II secretory pathway pseudopilin PulG
MKVWPAAADRGERGYAMVALLILMAVMAIAMTVALPAWNTLSRREKEAELVFRGEQYARAIALFQRKYAGAFPPTVDVLINERFLRKKFKDPITNDDFQLVAVGQAVAGPQSADPLNAGRGGATGQTQTGGPRGGTGGAAAGAGNTTAGRSGTTSTPAAGRSTFTLNTTAGRAAQAGATGAGGATPGFMGVTSKSKDPSLRTYKGGDHYDQWLFIATQATNQAGGRGGQTPGEGIRGGAPPGGRPAGPGRPGGPGPGGGAGGRQAQPPGFSPFGGTNPFNPGQGPAPTAPPGRGR